LSSLAYFVRLINSAETCAVTMCGSDFAFDFSLFHAARSPGALGMHELLKRRTALIAHNKKLCGRAHRKELRKSHAAEFHRRNYERCPPSCVNGALIAPSLR
jgi:hypothetical protein